MKTPATDENLKAAGDKTRRKVLGDAHVDRSHGNSNAFDAPFVNYMTEMAWGKVWSEEGLTLRERSLLTVTILASLGRLEELALHLRGTANTGATADDIRQAFMHVAVYAGVPAANTAFRIAKPILAEIEEQRKKGGGSI